MLPPLLPPMVRANLSPRATFNNTTKARDDEDADATGRIAMIGGDDENAKVVSDDGDEKTAISSNKASRTTAGGHVVGIVMLGVL